MIQDEVKDTGSSPDTCRRRKNIGTKYKYRSSYCEQEQEISSPDSSLDQENVVNRFIKVVGADQENKKRNEKREQSDVGGSKPLSSREDIRKKLASFGEETIPEEPDADTGTNNLEICFINETASDDEEEEDGVTINPLESHSDEEHGNSQESVLIPR